MLSRDDWKQLADKWTEDETFRRAFEKDPEGAVKGLGLVPGADDLARIRARHEAMAEGADVRMSKGFGPDIPIK